jgi:K+-sensing histidine kinase KdpD
MDQLASQKDNFAVDNLSIIAPTNSSHGLRMQLAGGAAAVNRRASSATLIASLLSHDIRHHLSAVYCNAEFLSHAAILEADRKQLFEEVKAAIADATEMLDFILFHSKGDFPAEDAVQSFNGLIEKAVSAIRPHPHAQGVSIMIHEAPTMYAMFNQTLVSSAVYNLLLNACFAAQRTGEQGQVEIGLRTDHEFVCILVKDNGPGVPIDGGKDLSKPFVPKGKPNGTGIGITIADSVAREYGGNLELESSCMGCTMFALRLAKKVLHVMDQSPTPYSMGVRSHCA